METTERCFQKGDHVYTWNSYCGIPYQHHGIVVDVDRMKGYVTVLDFTNRSGEDDDAGSQILDSALRAGSFLGGSKPSSSSSSSSTNESTSYLREYTIDESSSTNKSNWQTVRYDAGRMQRIANLSGTSTAASSDPVGLVLARAEFLIEHQHLLPPYDLTKCNCEHVAIWCKTGHFCSLQSMNLMTDATCSVAQMAFFRGSDSGGGFPSTTTTTTTAVAQNGTGMIGSVVGSVVASVMPAIIAGSVSTGYARYLYWKHGKQTADLLNDKFTEQNLRGNYLPHLPMYTR